MSPITTHVLDTALGRPAAGVPLLLSKFGHGGWIVVGRGATDADGRCKDLLKEGSPKKGVYRLTFDVARYFKKTRRTGFYPSISIDFAVRDARHHHVPLLLSPWGYSTYRGS
jgi:5-hydroxyisourate hydrolase